MDLRCGGARRTVKLQRVLRRHRPRTDRRGAYLKRATNQARPIGRRSVEQVADRNGGERGPSIRRHAGILSRSSAKGERARVVKSRR